MPFLRVGLPLLLLVSGIPLSADQELLRAAAESNVNQRYLIESISFAGVDLDDVENSSLPASLRTRLKDLIGQNCDVAALESLSAEIRRELHFRTVTQHLSKGSAPDKIRVDFEAERHDLAFDVSLPKFLYNSQQGATGEVDASLRFKNNTLAFGLVSNGDDLVERFSGITARFESAAFGPQIGAGQTRLGITFEDYHEQWNSQTVAEAAEVGLDRYRSRWNVAPELTIAVARPVTVSFGTSFERMESENHGVADRYANAATFGVHAGHKIEGNGIQQQLDWKYSLRVATHMLGSSYSYARHMITARYEARSGRHTISSEFVAGSIAGNAPFFDRFVLGSSSTLRGWNRYDIDPVGGNRVVHNEIAYSYRIGEGSVEGFYDVGALWHSDGGRTDRTAEPRHSLGIGYKQGIFVLSMAVPVRDGRIEPVFMAGMNY
ncbi:MAG TPA: BamA/TamA family outer membrane protein [Bryobacteraceae bacterium]|jgi:hypothetical protein|nr:BamA/TamA family outer membrane protein [Bryobacteraceae bacterium]